ncbi:MAG: formylglycine-generating enzyme family protein [Chloroflexota bacterium]
MDSLKNLSLKSKRNSVKPSSSENLDLYKFIQIPPTEEIQYTFAIGKYPVTNAQYERFLNAPDFAEKSFWFDFPKFDDDCVQIGKWGMKECDNWIQEEVKFVGHMPRPFYLEDKNFGISDPDNPVVYVSWFEANAYCKWLMYHWGELAESLANPDLHVLQIRLPLDFEWSFAAGGEMPENRYPWDKSGNITKEEKEIVRRANVLESRIGHTTPVNAYLRGASPYGVMDMAGNVWEWQANYQKMKKGWLCLRSGSWNGLAMFSHVSARNGFAPIIRDKFIGFRVACLI